MADGFPFSSPVGGDDNFVFGGKLADSINGKFATDDDGSYPSWQDIEFGKINEAGSNENFVGKWIH